MYVLSICMYVCMYGIFLSKFLNRTSSGGSNNLFQLMTVDVCMYRRMYKCMYVCMYVSLSSCIYAAQDLKNMFACKYVRTWCNVLIFLR